MDPLTWHLSFKHRCERQTQPIHSSPMELETVCHVQNPTMTSSEYGLNAVHLHINEMGNTMGTLTVNNAITIQHTLYKRLYLLEPLWKLRLPLDGSKCHLFDLLIIHTPEALPHGMVQPIKALCLKGSKI